MSTKIQFRRVTLGCLLVASAWSGGLLYGQCLSNVVAPDGSIAPSSDHGTYDASDWHMTLAADGTPTFHSPDVPSGESVAPPPPHPDDRYWSPQFSASGTVGKVNVVARFGCDQIYVGGVFDHIGTTRARNIARWDGNEWHALGREDANGVDGEVFEIATDENGDVYVGGRFDSAGSELVYNLAKWDGSEWSGIGGGVDAWDEWDLPAPGIVYSVIIDDDLIYVGGDFDSVGTGIVGDSPQLFARNVALWNGSEWRALGPGLVGAGDNQPTDMGTVRDLAFGFDGIYAVGRFVASSQPLNGIARWDGSTWRPVGENPEIDQGKVDIRAVEVSGADVYVGGRFQQVGGITVNNVAVWSGTTRQWFAFGDGSDSPVYDIAVDGRRLFASGTFESEEGLRINNVGYWYDNEWHELGSGPENGTDSAVLSLTNVEGRLYIAGRFQTAGPTSAGGLALWDIPAQSWKPLRRNTVSGGGANGPIYAVSVTPEYVYVGGRFSSVGQVKTNSLARWHRATGVWSPLGGGIAIDPNVSITLLPSVRAITVEGDNVYVGGRFDFAGGVRCNNVARWDGFGWRPLGDGIGRNSAGGPYDSVSTVYALDADGPDLYVGGEFVVAGGFEANRIARWNNNSESWHQVGGGIGGASFTTRVNAVAAANGRVYVGGVIATVGSTQTRAKNIAMFDGDQWSAMDRGFNSTVLAIAVDSSGTVFAGGEFTTADFTSVDHVARWSGDEWEPLGDGTNGDVNALVAGNSGVYAAGEFTMAGIGIARGIAHWTNGDWSAMGTGLVSDSDDRVSAYSLSLDGEDVFVGGRFDRAGSASSQNIAYWFKPVPNTDRDDQERNNSGRVGSKPDIR